jgi:UDP-N-acetylglucosamine 2-epimerase (non-hydrolysing)
MNKLKVLTVLGTRPEIIRLSRVIAVLDRVVDHVIVHTGQNYDHELNQVFFDELSVRKPDYFLNVDTSSLGRFLGGVLENIEEVILKEKPDAMLVLGDTNSAIAVLMAKRMKVPTYHMEAGNRSYDANVPEEINRKMVDHLADFNLVYTENARRHLIAEGLNQRFIYMTGSPMREVLEFNLAKINSSNILQTLNLQKGSYFVASIHREENVDNRQNLEMVLDCLRMVHDTYGFPVVVSTHPRTQNRLKSFKLDDSRDIRFLKPFGFFDYNFLQMSAFCTISDSGTISEESSILGFPAVSLRRSIERPEALDVGAISLTGLEPSVVLQCVELAVAPRDLFSGAETECPDGYKVRNTSERVVKLIVGTAKLANSWRNMDKFSRYEW